MATQFNGQKLELRYLFRVVFVDGHAMEQTPEDVSTLEPEKRSAFYDVLEHEKKSPILFFSLIDQKTDAVVFLDMTSGLFMVNHSEINIADQNFIPEAPFKLIYFRETRLDTEVKKTVGAQDEVLSSRHYVNRFFIGWETMWQNKKYQRTIALDP